MLKIDPTELRHNLRLIGQWLFIASLGLLLWSPDDLRFYPALVTCFLALGLWVGSLSPGDSSETPEQIRELGHWLFVITLGLLIWSPGGLNVYAAAITALVAVGVWAASLQSLGPSSIRKGVRELGLWSFLGAGFLMAFAWGEISPYSALTVGLVGFVLWLGSLVFMRASAERSTDER